MNRKLASLCCAIWLCLSLCTLTAAQSVLLQKTDITPGYKIIGGDIQVPLNHKAGAALEIRLWPNGVVYYAFDNNVTEANRQIARTAMRQWTDVAGASIKFQEGVGKVSGSFVVIRIQNSNANNSAVGMVLGGQVMNITSWGTPFRITHEFGHALGLVHEHSRPGRDTYVTIVTGNIESGKEEQFALESGARKIGGHDFDSVMHYDQCAFSKNADCPKVSPAFPDGGVTIKVNSPFDKQLSPDGVTAWPAAIGQRNHLSQLDQANMRLYYPRGDWRFVEVLPDLPVHDGSFFAPYNRLAVGVQATPPGGTLWLFPGVYTDANYLNKNITVRALAGGVTIRPVPTAFAPTLASVSAASYNGELAADSIAAAFGANLANGVIVANSLPLPTTLGGVTVKVKDAAGVEREAPLFFVSPNQINYQIPPGSSTGTASIAVYRGSTVVAAGEAPIVAASPALYSANASGQGVPAAVLLRVRADALFYEPVARFDTQRQQFVPIPLDLGPASDQVFLILYGGGFRSATSAVVTIGEEEAEVLYAGVAPGFVGLDQANVRLPRSLAGKGDVQLFLTADQRTSNAVTINVR